MLFKHNYYQELKEFIWEAQNKQGGKNALFKAWH